MQGNEAKCGTLTGPGAQVAIAVRDHPGGQHTHRPRDTGPTGTPGSAASRWGGRPAVGQPVPQPMTAARPASRRATGTLKGEQET